MNIQKVTIKEFKAIKDFEANLEGKNILVVGENGVGKSTFLQSISIALGNKKKLPTGVNGEWQVIADKDGREWQFKVKMKDGKATVETISPEGIRDVRVSALKQIVGAVEFDIDDFVKLSETEAGRKKQVEIYKSLLPEDVQEFIKDQELKIDAHYRDRADLNREIKNLKGSISDHPLSSLQRSPERVDTDELNRKINEASKINQNVTKISSGVEERTREISESEGEIERLTLLLQQQQERLENLKSEKEKGEKWLEDNKEVNIDEITQKLSEANETNNKADDWNELQKKREELEVKEDDSGHMTALIDSCRQAVTDAIRDCNLPIEGLEFDEEKLIYNGVAVEEASISTSEKIELGVRMKIVENPDSPLIIQRAESIGTERFKTILEIAKKHNLQVIAEEVQRGNDKLTIEFVADKIK